MHRGFTSCRRGRRAEDGHSARAMTAQKGHVASMIPDALFLFKGTVVFFVDTNQLEVFDRGKERGARTNGDAEFTCAEFLPHSVAVTL